MSSPAASPKRSLGLFYCLAFVSLEAIQAVYFGGVFQRMNSFLLGSAIFGLAIACSLLWVACRDRGQFARARREWRNLAKAGIGTAVSWVAYFVALQLIEPAVAYTVFSGLVPLTILAAARRGVPEASSAAGRGSRLGHMLIAVSLIYLCLASIAGLTGFERGGMVGGIGGVIALLATGLSSTWVIFYCRRLDSAGVTATALFGLRYLPYVALAGVAAAMGIDAKPPVPSWQISGSPRDRPRSCRDTLLSRPARHSPGLAAADRPRRRAGALPGLRPAGGGGPHRLFQLDAGWIGRLLPGDGCRGDLGGAAGKAGAGDEHGQLRTALVR